MRLPGRSSSYILGLLLVALAGLVYYLASLLDSPGLHQALEAKRQQNQTEPPSLGSGLSAARVIPALPVDAVNQAKADRLNAPDHPPAEDLQIVAEFISLYRRALGGNPTGQNEDITAALTGMTDPEHPAGRVFPPNSPAIKGGQLVDRWGTPFWFHPVSAHKMEIRSAGPDKQLFTVDDLLLSP